MKIAMVDQCDKIEQNQMGEKKEEVAPTLMSVMHTYVRRARSFSKSQLLFIRFNSFANSTLFLSLIFILFLCDLVVPNLVFLFAHYFVIASA